MKPRIDMGILYLWKGGSWIITKASEVARKVKDGFINAVSVGFNAKQAVERSSLPIESKYYGERGLYFKSAELLEVSIVTIPANPSATAKGIDPQMTKEIAQMVAKHILEVIEEDDRFVINFAKPQQEQQEEAEQESYDDKKDKEEDKQKSFNLALLAELLNNGE